MGAKVFNSGWCIVFNFSFDKKICNRLAMMTHHKIQEEVSKVRILAKAIIMVMNKMHSIFMYFYFSSARLHR